MPYCYNNIWCTWNDFHGLSSWLFGIAQIFNVMWCQMNYVLIPQYGYSIRGIVEMSLFMFIALSALNCDLVCALTNPGTVLSPKFVNKKEQKKLIQNGISVCKKCSIRKPRRAHHCSKCGTCILKMDHHCPWVNNCVGVSNQKYFIQFLIYVFIGETYAAICGIFTIYKWYITLKKSNMFFYRILPFVYPSLHFSPFSLQWRRYPIYILRTTEPYIHIILLCIESILSCLFAVFVTMMYSDQMRSLRFDATFIEQIKEESTLEKPKSTYECFKTAFQESFNWKWFFPLPGKYLYDTTLSLSQEFPLPSIPSELDMIFNESDDSDNDDPSQFATKDENATPYDYEKDKERFYQEYNTNQCLKDLHSKKNE